MKFLPFAAVLLLIGCNGHPDSIYETDKSDTTQYNTNSVDTTLENEVLLTSDFVNDGEVLKDVHLFYCNVGIYQEPALMIIEEEVTDEINGDGDYAEVKGYYYYVKNQKNLDVEGGLDIINGQYMLSESYKGKSSGYMQFSTNDFGKDFWSVSKDDKDQQEFNFHKIEPKDEEARSFTIKKQKYVDKHQVQDMSLEEEVFEEVEDKLAMVFIDDDKMIFDYSVVRGNFHTGGADGMAYKNTDGNYIFNGEEGCELTFVVGEDNVEVSENNCGYYHGARARLDGSYSK
ncbi:MAG: hypothetical protein ACI857_000683 [Arenicella sp.]|jgi:hypothetical protein